MPRTLDPTADYVTETGGLFGGHILVATHAITIVEEPARPGEFTTEQAQQLLDSGKIKLASDVRPTPVERPEDAVKRLADLEEINSSRFLIRAPWLDGGSEFVSGDRDKATARYLAVLEEGLAAYGAARDAAAATNSPANADAIAAAAIDNAADGFAITDDGSNGYYRIEGPGIDEPERVRGRANAEKRLGELRLAAAEANAGPTVDPLVELGAAALVVTETGEGSVHRPAGGVDEG